MATLGGLYFGAVIQIFHMTTLSIQTIRLALLPRAFKSKIIIPTIQYNGSQSAKLSKLCKALTRWTARPWRRAVAEKLALAVNNPQPRYNSGVQLVKGVPISHELSLRSFSLYPVLSNSLIQNCSLPVPHARVKRRTGGSAYG